MLDRGLEIAEDFLNAENRSGAHVLMGIGLLIGFGLTAAAIAQRGADEVDRAGRRAATPGRGVVERPRGLISALSPFLMSATTLSAMRVWNAPATAARSRALGLWGVTQLTQALIIAARPRRFGFQIAGAMVAAGLASAYAHEARKLDRRAATIAAPTGARMGLTNLARDVARRRLRERRPA